MDFLKSGTTSSKNKIPFSLVQLIIQDDAPGAKYETINSFTREYKESLKLLNLELVLLNRYWNPSEIKRPLFVFVGDSTRHLVDLVSLLNQYFDFIFFSTETFDDRLKSSNVRLIEEEFDDHHLARLKDDADRIFFVSNYTSAEVKRFDKIRKPSDEILREKEYHIAQDMELQRHWINNLNPCYAMIKFRPPHSYEWNEDEEIEYMDGVIYAQPYNDIKSSETRMILERKQYHVTKKIKISNYNRALNYFNQVIRESFRDNPILNNETPLSSENGLFNRFDQIAFASTLIDFFRKFGHNPRVKEVVNLFLALRDFE